MRVARVVVLFAVAGTLLAGCGGQAARSAPSPSAATTTAAAGNGVAALTADEIMAKALAALKMAGSFQVKGESEGDGEKLSLDFKFRGDDLGGTIGNGASNAQLLRVGGQSYFKADSNFWKENGGPKWEVAVQMMGDKWVKIRPDDPGLGDLFRIADVEELFKPEGTFTKGEVKTIDAGSAIALVDSSDQSMVYVATVGEPYPLLVAGPEPTDQIIVSGFGSSFGELKAPAETEVVDFSKITSGG